MALGVSCVLGLGSAPERVQVTLELKARQKAAFVGRLQSATPTRRIRMQKGEGCDRRGPPRRVDHFSFTAACVRFYLGLGKARGRSVFWSSLLLTYPLLPKSQHQDRTHARTDTQRQTHQAQDTADTQTADTHT